MKADEASRYECGGGRARVRWPKYSKQERAVVDGKFLGDWEDLDFMEDFWEPAWDERDIRQYRVLAKAWRLRSQGRSFNDIGAELSIDPGKACALVSGKNLRPYLAQAYLNRKMLPELRSGWKWTLQTTPKPTDPYPTAYKVPTAINDYTDVTEFLGQFPPLPETYENLAFFGLPKDWASQHIPDLFGFLLGFLVGDAGKYYSEYETRARHYGKSAVTTNMADIESNHRLLRYVQMALDCVGIRSHQISGNGVLRWNSEASNLVTWMLKVCLGLKAGERTSRNPIRMPWLTSCPREVVAAFLQGVAESDGYVSKKRNIAEIASVPNSEYIKSLLEKLGSKSKTYKLKAPTIVRTTVQFAYNIPIFNPLIRSDKHNLLFHRLRELKPSPPPSFYRSLTCAKFGVGKDRN